MGFNLLVLNYNVTVHILKKFAGGRRWTDDYKKWKWPINARKGSLHQSVNCKAEASNYQPLLCYGIWLKIKAYKQEKQQQHTAQLQFLKYQVKMWFLSYSRHVLLAWAIVLLQTMKTLTPHGRSINIIKSVTTGYHVCYQNNFLVNSIKWKRSEKF